MLTDDLYDVMTRAAAEQPFGLDVRVAVSQARGIRLRRRAGASMATAMVAAVAIAAGIAVHLGDFPGLSQRTTPERQAVAAFSHWGPTRGSLASSPSFLGQVRQEWSHPTGPESEHDIGSLGFSGPLKILFAGQTPDGPAAVVAQRSHYRSTGILVGVMTTIPGYGLSLWGPNSPDTSGESTDSNVGRFSANQVSFSSGTGRHIIVLPTDPSDTLSVSVGHQLNAVGSATRTWAAAPTTGGVAVVAAPTKQTSWDTLVRVFHGGRFESESRVWINASTFPLPANELRSQSQIGAVVGDSAVGLDADTYTAWTRLHGPADQPYGVSGWNIEGTLPDGSGLLAQQMWLFGDPAHTVVLHEQNNNWQVLSDVVTKAAARPLLAVRLTTVGGWLIGAGPHAAVTGYRVAGTKLWITPSAAIRDWSGPEGETPELTRAAAFIPILAPRIQLRMMVNGQSRIVTERS